MKKDFTLTLIAALLSVSASAQQPAQHTVLYHNATLLNPATEQQLTDGWLLGSEGQLGRQGFAGMAFGEARASGGAQAGRDRGRDRQTHALAYLGGDWNGMHVVGLFGAGRFDRQIDRGLLLGGKMQGVASGYAGRYVSASVEAGRRIGQHRGWVLR